MKAGAQTAQKVHPMTTIYAATTNGGKLREFAESARGEGVIVEALPGMEFLPVPVEDAATFMGNAELKAVSYSRAIREHSHLSEMLGTQAPLVMADDSGLEVEALGGRPGVLSARFAEDMGFGPEIEPSLANVWPGMTKDTRN